MFFKGYIETSNKKAAEKFKNRDDFKTLEQVEKLSEYAGILAHDTILIDVDDFEMSEILFNIVQDLNLNCRVYKTTRGKHFLFRNSGVETNKTGTSLGIGLKADIKIGTRNSYEVLKFNGVKREILHDVTNEDDASSLPRWLFPVKSKLEFLDMTPGDGRNQSLFNYILTLQSYNYSVEEARECIRLINKYVLKVPLEESELETILRDDSFKKPIFYMGTTFLFDKFATFLKNNAHIIKINNQLHLYKDGIYISGQDAIESEMIKHLPTLNRAKRKEVFDYLNLIVDVNLKPGNANLIAFKNGIYNIMDDTFNAFSPEYIITNKINWDFVPGAYSNFADGVLNDLSCHDEQVRSLLEEAIGYCFFRWNELGKAFILLGDKSNGKSTFLAIVQELLGEENTASLDLKELGDRFKTAELFGKLANIGDDIGDEFIANPSIFKKLVTGDRVSAERKGQNPFEFNNYSKFLFSANAIPRIKDKTGAVQRRLVIIPFEANFSKDSPNFRPNIKHELLVPEVMEYLIQIGIQGLKRVLETKGFTISDRVQGKLDEYEEDNNPILGFLSECRDEGIQIENEVARVVYGRYQEYCIANSLQAMSNIQFSKQINRMLGLKVISKKINKKVCRIFVAAGEG